MSRISQAPDELLDLMAAACNRGVDQSDLDRLEALIGDDPAAMRLLLDVYQLEAELQLSERARQATRATLAEVDELRQSSTVLASLADESRSGALPSSPLVNLLPSGRSRWPRPLALGVMTLVLTGVLWTAFFAAIQNWARSDARPIASAPKAAPQKMAARLVATRGCRWRGDASLLFAGAFLPEGRLLELASGLAEIRFHNGSVVLLEGPASLCIESAHAGTLDQGRLTAQVPDAARGFTLQTPAAQIVDLGTSFAVEAAGARSTEVYVLAGLVAVRHELDDGTAGQVVLRTGESTRVSPRHPGIVVRQRSQAVRDRFTWQLRPQTVASAIVQTDALHFNELHFPAAANDLIHRDAATLADVTHLDFTPYNYKGHRSTADALHDGEIGVSVLQQGPIAKSTVAFDRDGQWTSTFTLDTSVHTLGYDLTEIRTIAGWQERRASQRYKLWLRFVGDPAFVYYGTYALDSFDDGASMIRLTHDSGRIADGVDAVRFEFLDPGRNRADETSYREIDLLGQPTIGKRSGKRPAASNQVIEADL